MRIAQMKFITIGWDSSAFINWVMGKCLPVIQQVQSSSSPLRLLPFDRLKALGVRPVICLNCVLR